MSENLWQDNLALWQTQDKMNELHTQRIDELTKLVQELANYVASLAIKPQATCGGKKCACGKVAH